MTKRKEFDREKIWLNDIMHILYPEWSTISFTVQMNICKKSLRLYEGTIGIKRYAIEEAEYLFRRYINGEEEL